MIKIDEAFNLVNWVFQYPIDQESDPESVHLSHEVTEYLAYP